MVLTGLRRNAIKYSIAMDRMARIRVGLGFDNSVWKFMPTRKKNGGLRGRQTRIRSQLVEGLTKILRQVDVDPLDSLQFRLD